MGSVSEEMHWGMVLEGEGQRAVKVSSQGDAGTVSAEVLQGVLSEAQHMAALSDHTTVNCYASTRVKGATSMERGEMGVGTVDVLEKDERGEVSVGTVDVLKKDAAHYARCSSTSAASLTMDTLPPPGVEAQGTLPCPLPPPPPDQAHPKAKRTSILGFLGRLAAPILGKTTAAPAVDLQGRNVKSTQLNVV